MCHGQEQADLEGKRLLQVGTPLPGTQRERALDLEDLDRDGGNSLVEGVIPPWEDPGDTPPW